MRVYKLSRLNSLSRDEFVRVVGPVFEHSPWIAEAAWAQRPFASLERLHLALVKLVQDAGEEKQLRLIQAHPDLVGRAALAGTLTPESNREQASAGLGQLTPEEIAAFQTNNQAYREKFGFPFVICARLNKKQAILKGFDTRLQNTRVQEMATALEEIGRIAWWRLKDLVIELTAAEMDLLLGIKTGKSELFERGLEAGASLQIRAKSDFTPLMLSVVRQRPAMLQVLLDRGADVNATTLHFNFTALHFAAELPSVEVTRLLLDHGADVNALSSKHRSPLFAACEEGLVEQTKILLTHGARHDLIERGGVTALAVALGKKHFEIADCLLAAGADVDQPLSSGRTYLMDCAYWKTWDIIPYLLKAGANPQNALALAEEEIDDYEQWDAYREDLERTVRIFRDLKSAPGSAD